MSAKRKRYNNELDKRGLTVTVLEKGSESIRDMLLANLVMLGEIPAPTFEEKSRNAFLIQRFSECGLNDCSMDELDNGMAFIPGSDGARTILIVSHTDSVFTGKTEHSIMVDTDRVIGPGVGSSSLGLAVLATMPTMLERLGIKLKSNLFLLGVSRGLGRGNLEGMRFFLENCRKNIDCAICLEGVQLGSLSYATQGMFRGEISAHIPESFDWMKYGSTSAILVINEVINRIVEIPLPKRPRTNIVIGAVEGGTTYNSDAIHAGIKLEVRSESIGTVQKIHQKLEDIIANVSNETGTQVMLDAIAGCKKGGIEANHPLVKCAQEAIKAIELQPQITPNVAELAALVEKKIPAIAIAITKGENLNEPDEYVKISPMFKGIAQLLMILLSIDEGHCDEH